MKTFNDSSVAIRNPQLSIMTVLENSGCSVKMSDGYSYCFKPFVESEIGTRFAVVKDFSSGFVSGIIVLWEAIYDNTGDGSKT